MLLVCFGVWLIRFRFCFSVVRLCVMGLVIFVRCWIGVINISMVVMKVMKLFIVILLLLFCYSVIVIMVDSVVVVSSCVNGVMVVCVMVDFKVSCCSVMFRLLKWWVWCCCVL